MSNVTWCGGPICCYLQMIVRGLYSIVILLYNLMFETSSFYNWIWWHLCHQNVKHIHLLVIVLKSALLLSPVCIWIISWRHPSQMSESYVGLCSLRSQYWEIISSSVSLVEVLFISLTVSCLSLCLLQMHCILVYMPYLSGFCEFCSVLGTCFWACCF